MINQAFLKCNGDVHISQTVAISLLKGKTIESKSHRSINILC